MVKEAQKGQGIFVPRSIEWSSSSILDQLDPKSFGLTPERQKELRDLFWNDLCSEYDAENFCRYYESSGLKYSQEFQAFERAWRRDEWNHYIGFRDIYSALYDVPQEEIHREQEKRPVDFGPIQPFLEDEFTMTLLLAYDEIATTKAYAMDYDLYGSFPNPNLLDWIKLVTRDEAFHFGNCIDVIRLRHQDRIPEAPEKVRKFVEWDLAGNEYQGTFVLDHHGYYFTPDFLQGCADTILHQLNKEPSAR